ILFNAAATLVAGGSATFVNSYVFNSNPTFAATSNANMITFSGSGLLASNATITDNALGQVTFSGSLGEAPAQAGGRALTLAGPGTIVFSAANTYSGGTNINMTSGGSLGTVSINSGSTLSNPTTANPLYASSLGSGTITFSGANGAVLNNAAGSALTLSNFLAFTAAQTVAFTGSNLTLSPSLGLAVTLPTGALNLLPTNTTTFTGIFTAGGTATLTLSGLPIISGTTTIAPTTSGNFVLTGPTSVTGQQMNVVVSGGNLQLSGAGTFIGSAASTTIVNQGGGIVFDNSATAQIPSTTSLSNRWANAAANTWTFNGGSLQFNGSNATSATTLQTLGNATFATSNSQVLINQGTGGPAALTFGSYTRTNGAVVVFQASTSDTSPTQTFDTSNVV